MSTITMQQTENAIHSTVKQELVTRWRATWILPEQEVVAFGTPSDAGVGGRLAVREHAEALRRLRDS